VDGVDWQRFWLSDHAHGSADHCHPIAEGDTLTNWAAGGAWRDARSGFCGVYGGDQGIAGWAAYFGDWI